VYYGKKGVVHFWGGEHTHPSRVRMKYEMIGQVGG
jgi:hypothetical protein